MAAFVGRAEAARILGITEHRVVALSAAGKLGPVVRGPGGGFVWDRVAVVAYAQQVTDARRRSAQSGSHARRPIDRTSTAAIEGRT